VTGPGPGKIPLEASVYLEPAHMKLDAEVYLHVKGYSNARVTHLDIEYPGLERVVGESRFLKLIGLTNGFEVKLIPPVKVEGRYITRLVVRFKDFRIIEPGVSTIAWVGVKRGGIYIGFRKEYVKVLEAEAIRRGISPL